MLRDGVLEPALDEERVVPRKAQAAEHQGLDLFDGPETGALGKGADEVTGLAAFVVFFGRFGESLVGIEQPLPPAGGTQMAVGHREHRRGPALGHAALDDGSRHAVVLDHRHHVERVLERFATAHRERQQAVGQRRTK